MRDTVLVVVAHPDDETIFMGGLIAELSVAGACVDVLCATGRFGDRAWTTIRLTEFRHACRKLGARPCALDLPDIRGPLRLGQLETQLASAVRGLHYDAVYTHGIWGEYGHPHHRSVCLAVHNVFGNGVHSLAGPLTPCRTKSLSLRELHAKRALASRFYASQPFASDWCTGEERFTQVPAKVVTYLELIPDYPSRSSRRPRPNLRKIAEMSLAAFERSEAPFPEVERIPEAIWRPRHRAFAHGLSQLLKH